MKYSIKFFLGIFIIALVSAWSQPPNKLTSKEVLEDFFNASGGLEKWENLKNLQVGGTYEAGGESMTFYSYYNHIDSQTKYESDKLAIICSLTGEWLKANGRDWQNLSKAHEITNQSLHSTLLTHLRNIVHPIAFFLRIYSDQSQVLELAENPIADSDDIALVLVPDKEIGSHRKSQYTMYFLFDSSTKLLSKTVNLDGEGDITRVVSHSDYQEVDGFTISHTQEGIAMKTTYPSLGLSSTLEGATITHTYSSFKFNEEIDSSIFVVK